MRKESAGWRRINKKAGCARTEKPQPALSLRFTDGAVLGAEALMIVVRMVIALVVGIAALSAGVIAQNHPCPALTMTYQTGRASMAAIADSKGEVQWKCPITGKCNTSKLHRRCNGDDCGTLIHCYDCCSLCQANCQEPPEPPNYDLPEGETW